MILALGVIFWVLIIVTIILWIMQRPPQPWPWPNVLLFICIVLLGVEVFGGLHFVR